MTFATAAEAKRYARDKQIDLNAAKARKDIRASDAVKEARNKRDWALRRLKDQFGVAPDSDDEAVIEAFLIPEKAKVQQ